MIIYGLQYSDKTSLSSGVVFGLPEDTGVTPAEFANLSSFFCECLPIPRDLRS